MAVQTGKPFHARTMDFLSDMALDAESLIGRELVDDIAVALRALETRRRRVPDVILGVGDIRRVGVFLVPLPMTVHAEFLRHYDFAVSRRNRLVSEKDELHYLHHLILPCCVMTVMAGHLIMLALLPCGVGGIVDMTHSACVGIMLEILIDSESCITRTDHNEQDEHGDEYPCLPREFLRKPGDNSVNQR
jgi:hypothetical protein